RAGVAVAVLALGELSAGKLVETPGSETFAHAVFVQMHYGVTNDLAALCLVLLLVVLAAGSLAVAALTWTAHSTSAYSSSGRADASRRGALGATASVTSMYATPASKSVRRHGVPVRMALTKSASTCQLRAFSAGIGSSSGPSPLAVARRVP